MTALFVIYPEKFGSYEKFQRKLLRITKNFDRYTLFGPHDTMELLNRFSIEQGHSEPVITSILGEEITHAVVFDDGNSFIALKQKILDRCVPTRYIQTPITTVINLKREPQYAAKKSTRSYEYIGRGSYWGNPYSMYENGESREEVIRKFKYDFDYDKFPNKKKSEVEKLRGKTLGCYCSPAPCHGDVLANFLNESDDGL